MSTLACLYTTVKNISGKVRSFPYLREHGASLADNATLTVPGNLINALGAKLSKRDFNALERSLDRGSLEIVNTPAVFLKDTVTDETQQLTLSGGVLGVADPCWVAAASSSAAA